VEPKAEDFTHREFPYVVAFDQGSSPIHPEDVVTENPNALGLIPRGTVIDVVIKEGSWHNGDAKGYLVLMHVQDDFWDFRHGGGLPQLFVGATPKAVVSYVSQVLPVIWEAPDDPDAGLAVHDRRFLEPDTIPRGGVINQEGRVSDIYGPEKRAFDWIKYPLIWPKIEFNKTIYEGWDDGEACPDGGKESIQVPPNTDVTYCFVITNTSEFYYLNRIWMIDTILGISIPGTPNGLILKAGNPAVPLAPGESLIYYLQDTLQQSRTNVATAGAIASDRAGNEIPWLPRTQFPDPVSSDNAFREASVTDDDTAQAEVAETTCTDNDNDTYYAEGGDCGPEDCDDDNPLIFPGAGEICHNNVDDDCDGVVDCVFDAGTYIGTVYPLPGYWLIPCTHSGVGTLTLSVSSKGKVEGSWTGECKNSLGVLQYTFNGSCSGLVSSPWHATLVDVQGPVRIEKFDREGTLEETLQGKMDVRGFTDDADIFILNDDDSYAGLRFDWKAE
jgi:hypothetical protein